MRRYGRPPYCVAVVHGGPGAAGGMGPVARRLGEGRGGRERGQTGKTDAVDPLLVEAVEAGVESRDAAVFQSVWGEAAELRRTGGLMELARRVSCPVTAIHGDWDPHPAAGVREPLAAVVREF